jgi:predicted O-linked N-acetylglucosamine transferase (SPINDLY family)
MPPPALHGETETNMPTLEETFRRAMHHHGAGQACQAEEAYRQILADEPACPEAHHNLSAVLKDQGRYEEALPAAREAVRLRPDLAETHTNLGAILAAQGHDDEAGACYRKSLSLKPGQAEAHNNLGALLAGQGKLEEAAACYRYALYLRPDYAEAHSNLGNLFLLQGQTTAALRALRRALQLKPNLAEAHVNLGTLYQGRGKHAKALAAFLEAVRLGPDLPEAHNNLGDLYYQQGRVVEAAACFERAVSLQPNFADAHSNLAIVHISRGSIGRALMCAATALRLKPDSPTAHCTYGTVLQAQAQSDEAQRFFEQALRLQPRHAEAHHHLGQLFVAQNQPGQARCCFEEALRLKPGSASAHVSLGTLAAEQGDMDKARFCYTRAMSLAPSDALRIRQALIVSPITAGVEALAEERRLLQAKIAQLRKTPLSVRNPAALHSCFPFYLAYHGLNDRELNTVVADLFAQACPGIQFTASHCQAKAPHSTARRILRVGFLSCHFRKHTIGRLTLGLVRNLSRADFHVTLLRFPTTSDPMVQAFNEAADRVVTLTPHLAVAREEIADQRLDILFFTDIGMDPWTYLLAFARLAPVQCVTWGHPVTTGIPNLDYYISSAHLEPEDADNHYSEKLVRLQHPPTCYSRPVLSGPPRSRMDFGLPEDGHIYLCPQSLFKIHPEFDRVLGEILRADLAGHLILLGGDDSPWVRLLSERFGRSIPGVAKRVRFIPRQRTDDFLHLLAVCDVILDTIHFSGGHTTLEALAVGTPIVTLPGRFMRGRVTYAYYQQMNMTELLAEDPGDYVRLAVRLGSDVEWNQHLRGRILATRDQVYDNTAFVRELEQFLKSAEPRYGRA